MDIVGWVIVAGVALVLYKLFWWFRVGVHWAAGIAFVLALTVGAVYPDIWDQLPGILNALVKL